MTERHWSRRQFLRVGGVVGAGALAGCLNDSPSCDDENVEVVFRSRLRGWYVDYPDDPGLSPFDEEIGEAPARRLAELAREAGYTVEYYFAEDYGRGTDDEWQIELYGDLDRATVEAFVREASMPDQTEITENTATLSRGAELRLPWEPGLLDGRAQFVADRAATVGVDVPDLGSANTKMVTLVERPSAETAAWLRDVLASRSMLAVELVNVPPDDSALTDQRYPSHRRSDREEEKGYFDHDRSDVEIRPDGTVETGLYLETVLKSLYRPGPGEDVVYTDRARLRTTLNGEVIEQRPLTDAELSFLKAYRDYIASDDRNDDPTAPRLALPTLDGREALRVGALLRYPTAVRYGVEVSRCES